MKRKRFSVEQITGILKQAGLGTPVQDLCRTHGVSEQSFYRGLGPEDDEAQQSTTDSRKSPAVIGAYVTSKTVPRGGAAV